MRIVWNEAMSKVSFFTKEGYADYQASVDELLNQVARVSRRPFGDMENVYKAMLQPSSRNVHETNSPMSQCLATLKVDLYK